MARRRSTRSWRRRIRCAQQRVRIGGGREPAAALAGGLARQGLEARECPAHGRRQGLHLRRLLGVEARERRELVGEQAGEASGLARHRPRRPGRRHQERDPEADDAAEADLEDPVEGEGEGPSVEPVVESSTMIAVIGAIGKPAETVAAKVSGATATNRAAKVEAPP